MMDGIPHHFGWSLLIGKEYFLWSPDRQLAMFDNEFMTQGSYSDPIPMFLNSLISFYSPCRGLLDEVEFQWFLQVVNCYNFFFDLDDSCVQKVFVERYCDR